MRGDAGGRIPVKSSDDSTWECGGETAAMDHTGRKEWPPELTDVLSVKGGTAEIPRGGVPRESGNEDSNAGALRAPAFPRHKLWRKETPPTHDAPDATCNYPRGR